MTCSSCGAQLTPEMSHCPTCGLPTPYYYAASGGEPNAPTVWAHSSYVAPPPPPSTDYGSPLYGMPLQNPYELLVPPPPPRHHVKTSFLLLIGALVAVLILTSTGMFLLLSRGANIPLIVKTFMSPTSPVTATASTSNTPAATGTTVAEHILYPPYRGTLALNDPLYDHSTGDSWQEINTSGGSCAFSKGAYQVKTSAGGYYFPCAAQNSDFSNFIFEVHMKITAGDCGGILFRVDPSLTSFYYFRVCQDGSYVLFLYKNNSGSALTYSSSADPAIKSGLNQSNVVAVSAQGNTFECYVNQQVITTVSDSTYGYGLIGVTADGFPHNQPTAVVYSNAKVWTV